MKALYRRVACLLDAPVARLVRANAFDELKLRPRLSAIAVNWLRCWEQPPDAFLVTDAG